MKYYLLTKLLTFFSLMIMYADDANRQSAQEPLELAVPFRDNAVLQRDKPVNVWGRAVPGDRIKVEFGGQEKFAVADEGGNWRLQLDAMSANSTPGRLSAVSGTTGRKLEIGNVVVGDVWFCSGQSNMLWSLRNTTKGAEEMATADYPLVRGFLVRSAVAEEPRFGGVEGGWVLAQSNTADANSSPIRHFSGVAYHFAKEMFKQTGVPVGFIQPSHGGTMIEAWMSREALASSPYHDNIQQRWTKLENTIPSLVARYEEALAEWEARQKEGGAATQKNTRAPQDPRGVSIFRHRPSSLFNAMTAPFMPYTISGILWYQGESNAGRSVEYEDLFPRMIKQYREGFGQGDLPFYFVQIANFDRVRNDNGRSWAFLREAQASAVNLPATAMVVTIDIGEADDVHPRNKEEVGRRLSLHALHHLYGKEIVTNGPIFDSAMPRDGSLRISFRDSPELDLRVEDAPKAFEVAGADGVFHPARAIKEDKELVVSSDKVASPAFVRYAWFNNPTAVLFGSTGLPAAPFRSDQEPEPPAAMEGSSE